MTAITLRGSKTHTNGKLPEKGEIAQNFSLVKNDLSEVTLETYRGQRKILNIFPSLDTPVCSASVRKFHEKISELKNVVLLCISKDLPFAQKRFCEVEGIKNVEALSAFRSSFPADFGLEIIDGPLKGLCSRAVLVLDENNKILYSEQVSEISHEPHYEAALKVLTSL